MAIALGNNLGSASNAIGASPLVLTTTAAAAASSVIVVWVSGPSATVSTLVDSAGNSYTKAREHTNGTSTGAIWFAYGALSSGGTITATFSATPAAHFIAAHSYTGWTGVSQHQVNSASQFNATAWNSGNVTTTVADALLVGLGLIYGVASTSTPTASYNERHDISAGTEGSMTSVDRLLTATGTYAASGTWAAATGGDNTSVVVTLIEAAAATLPLVVMAPPAAR